MPRSRQLLCLAYAAIAVIALVGTWHQNLSYFQPDEGWVVGFPLATMRFWGETLATHASTSITVDLLLLCLPLFALMILEARRLEIPFIWLYIIFGALVAISVTFPLFLIARERRLAARGESAADLGLTQRDTRALLGLSGLMVLFTLWTLFR
jgi:hypothetical protein